MEVELADQGTRLGAELAQAYLARRPAPAGWRDRLSGLDMAYAAQDAMVEAFSASGQGTVAGYKVGMTTKSMQQLCGIDTPIGGKVLRANILGDDAELRRADYIHLGIESELAFCLSRDIDAPLEGSDEEVLGYVATAHAAFEVVDDRLADFSRLVAAELVAENVWNVGIVLGQGLPPSELGPIDQLGGRYFENGDEIAVGKSSDVLGNPLNVLRWLARFLLERGSKLRAGEVIMTGSIGPLRFPAPGTACRFEIDGLPPVEVRIV
jgi:2-oxo-3-hexenedioate decarboxylase/2-keto-4-pentenoate hydratase